ncbi:hypothetical protein HUJ05_007773 [Dendroctonus ponderosae]|nr:hypothetical protein HUJ05_007773 [Dendroctonus ponderosae]
MARLQCRKKINMWVQLDGAPPHYYCGVRQFLNANFQNRCIGRNGFENSPPRSPDLTPLDFFLWDKRLPMCLLCNKVLSNDSMKPSKLEDYLRRCHPEKIAKSGKSHTMGEEFILPAIEEVLKTVLHETVFDVLKRIPLSNNTIKRRIDEMSSDIENFLCNYLQTTHFSIQLDESTLPGNEALLLAYVRFVMDEEIHKELLFAKTLKSCTKGESKNLFHLQTLFRWQQMELLPCSGDIVGL